MPSLGSRVIGATVLQRRCASTRPDWQSQVEPISRQHIKLHKYRYSQSSFDFGVWEPIFQLWKPACRLLVSCSSATKIFTVIPNLKGTTLANGEVATTEVKRELTEMTCLNVVLTFGRLDSNTFVLQCYVQLDLSISGDTCI